MPGPLDGIKVLDLTRTLAGPYATMMMCDLGAEVIKVERPQTGDLSRSNSPLVGSQQDSLYFISVNRGKKSIVLDFDSQEGKQALLRLVKRVDVLVENFVPGVMKRQGLDYEVIREHNPGIIYAAISGFGQDGPYAQRPSFDIIAQAMGGMLSITGEIGGPPVRPGISLGDIAGGLFACIGILAALQERNKSGQGQMIDVSMLDCQVALLENAVVRYCFTGEVSGPLGTRHPVVAPFEAVKTKDSYVAVVAVADHWPLFCAAIDRVDLIDDGRFLTSGQRAQNRAELESIIGQIMRTKTTEEWLELLERHRVPCGPVNRVDQVVADEQVQHREMIVEVPHPRLGKVKVTNSPIKLSRTPAKVDTAPPDLGQHTEEILSQLEE